MISRTYRAEKELSEQSTSTAPVLAGLVSALRPVKRISTQLAEESLLLRRFSYKNKNQHKGCGWWRKVIEVDRVMERLGTELEGLLREFGFEKDKDEAGRITERSLVQGLLRLPRAVLIAEKSLSVLLGSASLLEQLLHSRAFMAFALVLVSLLARLHVLSTVLFLELSKLSLVLTRLVRSTPLYPTYQASLAQLPRALRHLLPPLSSPAFTPLSIPTSPASPPVDDELGSIVSRSQPGAGSVSTGTGSGGGASAEVIIPECEVTGLRKAGIAVRLEARADLGEGGEAAEGAKGSAGIGVLDREEGGKSGKGGKREEGGGSRSEEGGKRARTREVRGEEVQGKLKGEGKKRKKKRGGDEIDDIFG